MSAFFDVTLFASTFLTLFVIMDPPGILPIYLALTGTMTREARKRVAWQAVATSLGVMGAFMVFGKLLLDYLHVTVPALQLSGGLLLLIMGMQLLMGITGEEHGSEDRPNVAIVPLGTPLIAGPGAIVAVMLGVQGGGPAPAPSALAVWISVILAVLLMHMVMWATMRFSVILFRLLGTGGVSLLTRIAGLLLSAIAVQLMADAIAAFLAAG